MRLDLQTRSFYHAQVRPACLTPIFWISVAIVFFHAANGVAGIFSVEWERFEVENWIISGREPENESSAVRRQRNKQEKGEVCMVNIPIEEKADVATGSLQILKPESRSMCPILV